MRAQSHRRRWRDPTGTVTVELVLLAPVFVALLCLVVGAGRLVDAHSELLGAARDAARAASQAASPSAAAMTARATAAADLIDDAIRCGQLAVHTDTSSFTRGGIVRVQVTCVTTLGDVTVAGFPGHETLSGSAAAPIDTYRSVLTDTAIPVVANSGGPR